MIAEKQPGYNPAINSIATSKQHLLKISPFTRRQKGIKDTSVNSLSLKKCEKCKAKGGHTYSKVKLEGIIKTPK